MPGRRCTFTNFEGYFELPQITPAHLPRHLPPAPIRTTCYFNFDLAPPVPLIQGFHFRTTYLQRSIRIACYFNFDLAPSILLAHIFSPRTSRSTNPGFPLPHHLPPAPIRTTGSPSFTPAPSAPRPPAPIPHHCSHAPSPGLQLLPLPNPTPPWIPVPLHPPETGTGELNMPQDSCVSPIAAAEKAGVPVLPAPACARSVQEPLHSFPGYIL